MNLPKIPLGVDVMDRDHYALEHMFARTPQIADDDLPAHLDAILAEIAAHFVREEAAMEAAGVPILHCHRGQHAALLEEAGRLRNEFARVDAPARRHAIWFRLARLVSDHVASVDAISSRFFFDKAEESGAPAGRCG
ncbi:hypothetical protein GJ654_08090 [Rhodoblastus acidophilus]|uniref:Hemerythrin-like metal-binding domain protein n=1 Tax=Rhodoblastus acidophilus TaxID=1074 RepID=A0A6N8DP30_RHOAC|nr:hemerythrin family protein [Rhodoblastus acidophilus]MCW2273904.1 hemerythrin-like metal-binding protein [Rhodoblastus acidophilus]MTV30953.1 hypothetical protein [Rhodoblastus acidophilus]